MDDDFSRRGATTMPARRWIVEAREDFAGRESFSRLRARAARKRAERDSKIRSQSTHSMARVK